MATLQRLPRPADQEGPERQHHLLMGNEVLRTCENGGLRAKYAIAQLDVAPDPVVAANDANGVKSERWDVHDRDASSALLVRGAIPHMKFHERRRKYRAHQVRGATTSPIGRGSNVMV